MQFAEHFAKAQRLEDTRLSKLDLADDYEVVIWSCIHGGAQLLNVVFHKLGITEDAFDMIHTFVPEFDKPVPADVAEFMETLRDIEALGPRFVRGIEEWKPEEGERCLANYRKLKGYAEEVLKR